MNQLLDRDNGYDTLMALLRDGQVGRVTVGIHAAEASVAQPSAEGEGSGLTVGEVAAVHEFGLGVPRRSWLRDWVDGAQADIRQRTVDLAKAVLKEPRRRTEMLERFALWAKSEMQKRVVDGLKPDLSEAHKARKAKSGVGPKDTPLIWTGQLLSSIDGRVEK